MRVLVLQLARYGDIYQTWPVLNALKRTHPDAEIHVVVRARFREALTGIEGVHTHILNTPAILEPIFDEGDEFAAHVRLVKWLDAVARIGFDRIINLSFSPLSSYIADALTGPATVVSGYTRHADGYFHIPDDSSAYFYAQAGIGRANRYHVTDVFAAVAGVDLIEADFSSGLASSEPRQGVVVHLGASQLQKRYPPEQWVKVLRALAATSTFTLIGSADERALAETVVSQCEGCAITNRVGETTIRELFSILGSAELLIGADSAPIHIAALTGTRVLNLSSGAVNFWETGPRTPGSRVLHTANIYDLEPDVVAGQARSMLAGEAPPSSCWMRERWDQPYRGYQIDEDDFQWRLIQALYTAAEYPPAPNGVVSLAFQRVFESAELALQNIDRLDSPAAATAARILSGIDTILTELPNHCAEVGPLVRWFETERLRLPPEDPEVTRARTRQLFSDLLLIATVYRQHHEPESERTRASALALACAGALREYDFASVQPQFQELLSTLHELARHSTKVGAHDWSQVLEELNGALERRDFVLAADVLEHILEPAMTLT